MGKEAHLYLCNILFMGKEACLYNKIKCPSHNKIKMIGLFSGYHGAGLGYFQGFMVVDVVEWGWVLPDGQFVPR